MKRFLFIGHDAGRSGAPIVLLHLLRWIKQNKLDWTIDILLLRGGDLESEYSELGEVFVVDDGRAPGLLERIWKKFGSLRKLDPAPFERSYDAVLGNTVVSLPWLEHFQRRGVPTICWMHELAGAVATFYSDEEFERAAGFADHFVVPSKAVEKFLRSRRIDKPLTLVYEFSAVSGSIEETTSDFRLKAGIPQDAFVVLGSGTIEKRKGVDLFVEVAARVIFTHQDVYFVWVGGEARHEKFPLLLPSGPPLDDHLIFTGQLADPSAVFRSADIFALTSREDPFPLVCLEAAMIEKPIVCFADAGGIPELVEDDGGAVVQFGDTDAFADALILFYHDRNALELAGRTIKAKVETRFSLEASCEKLSRVLSVS